MKKVIVYSGRFQPMLSHHKKVYDELQREFPDADVYIGTSDKVEGSKSPFDFKEKQLIAQAHGIDPKKVLMAKRPYHKDDYSTYFDEENTHIFFAVGEKDLDRFPFNNVDEKTGLDMTVRGEPKPKYYQKINTYKQDPQPMSMRGYITLAPTIQLGDEVASASAFRDALQNAPDLEKAKEIYTKQFGEFDQKVFDLIYNKIKGSKMSEDINIMRKLAGLAEAPVDFNTEANPKEVTFLEPNKSSSKMSIANRFPPNVDANDPEIKKEQFINALMKSPANLLSEINERLDPKDSNNEAVGARLDDIISKLQKIDNIGQLENDDKMFVVDVVKVAIKDMSLVAGDDSEPEFDDEPEDEYQDWDDEVSKSNKTSAAVGNMEPIEDSVDIDYDYNVVEAFMYASKNEVSELLESMSDEEIAILSEIDWKAMGQKAMGAAKTAGSAIARGAQAAGAAAMDTTVAHNAKRKIANVRADMTRQKTASRDAAQAAQADLATAQDQDAASQAGVGQQQVDAQAQRQEIQQQIAMLQQKLAALTGQGAQPVNASLDLSDIKDAYGVEELPEEEIEEGGECYHCDGSDPDCEHCNGTGYVQFPDDPQEREPEEESFDPSMEPGREQVAYDEAMDALEKGGEEGLAKHLGMSIEEFDREINEWCAEHGKHADDDREDAIEGVLDEVIGNADWDDQYESIEESKCGCCGNDPCDCAPDCEGCKKMDEAVDSTVNNALDAAIQELKTLAGLNS